MNDLERIGDSLMKMQVRKKEKAQTGDLVGKDTCRKIKDGPISALSLPLLTQLRGAGGCQCGPVSSRLRRRVGT